jgi:molybdopterin-guanine dinucleotide biosynthesis protein A
MTEPVLGVVLAGGLGRRMGGGAKSLRVLAGRTILDRVLGRLAPQCAALILSANGDPSRFAAAGVPVVPDGVPGLAGPLAGILAGLDWAAAHRPDLLSVVSAPGDAPFLPHDLVSRLQAARDAGAAVLACAESGARRHPVAGLWPVALRHDLRYALVEEGMRRVGSWTARHRVAFADWPVVPLDPFHNVNTPADLEEAERLMALHGAG